MTNNAILIAHNHQGRKTESTASLCGLDHTVDGNHFFFQFQFSGFNPVYIEF